MTTARARSARRRRATYQANISAGQSLIVQIGEAWRWVLAEVRSLSGTRPTRWRRRREPVDDLLVETLNSLVGIADRLNQEGAKR